jgi:tyramine---L-glutamate ligase
LKIFVFEYVTGGGLYRETLPASLVREGDLMLQSLLLDLSGIAGLATIVTRDARLSAPALADQIVEVSSASGFDQCWQQCLDAADAVWLIAPETGGVLEKFGAEVLAAGKRLLGSTPDAVKVTASKFSTSARLAEHDVAVVPSYMPDDAPITAGVWVAKPDDGAGCEDTCRFDSHAALSRWLGRAGRMRTHVVQPWLPGEPASLSMLCRDGRAWLLSCNRQLIELNQGGFSYHGSVLNGMAHHWSALEPLAQRVAAAFPGLAGYVGVDLVVDDGDITVLEINPRLTTSYAGLSRAMGCNPARLVLDLFYNDVFELPPLMSRNVVKISLNA